MKHYLPITIGLIGVFFAVNTLAVEAGEAAANNFQAQLQTIQQSLDQQDNKQQAPSVKPKAQVTQPMNIQSPNTVSASASQNTNPSSNFSTQPEPQLTQPAHVDMQTSPVTKGNATAAARGNPAIELSDPLRDEAFNNVSKNILPLSPSQIEILRNMYDDTQRAASVYPGTPPRPTSSSVQVNLSPGASPPVIRLSAGFVTSLVFVDSTGAPWPIEAYSLGNPTAFNIQWDKKSNILLIQAITAHRVGNLAVILRGLNTPVMLNLTPGQPAMDVRVDIRVPGLGPDAKPSFEGLPGTESPALLSLLDGIPPPGAKNLKASDCEDCVWLVGDKLYLRTRFTVISPGWISTLSSADGTHVYEMQPTPLILATYNGKTIKLKIEGF